MRTPEEIVDFCKNRIKQLGLTQAEVLKKADCSVMLFVMIVQRNSYPKIETLLDLSKVLGVGVDDILGFKEEDYPDDIQQMISMLQNISPENRKMISMNIENYFRVEMQNKDISSR